MASISNSNNIPAGAAPTGAESYSIPAAGDGELLDEHDVDTGGDDLTDEHMASDQVKVQLITKLINLADIMRNPDIKVFEQDVATMAGLADKYVEFARHYGIVPASAAANALNALGIGDQNDTVDRSALTNIGGGSNLSASAAREICEMFIHTIGDVASVMRSTLAQIGGSSASARTTTATAATPAHHRSTRAQPQPHGHGLSLEGMTPVGVGVGINKDNKDNKDVQQTPKMKSAATTSTVATATATATATAISATAASLQTATVIEGTETADNMMDDSIEQGSVISIIKSPALTTSVAVGSAMSPAMGSDIGGVMGTPTGRGSDAGQLSLRKSNSVARGVRAKIEGFALETLIKSFEESKDTPKGDRLTSLAEQTGLQEHQVRNWFQNYRFKHRHQLITQQQQHQHQHHQQQQLQQHYNISGDDADEDEDGDDSGSRQANKRFRGDSTSHSIHTGERSGSDQLHHKSPLISPPVTNGDELKQESVDAEMAEQLEQPAEQVNNDIDVPLEDGEEFSSAIAAIANLAHMTSSTAPSQPSH
ncbi:hypothetical protein GQ42DRAFT_165631 [Ramicandelaber brevisporus]|nr:hypothetical protein GQ42DRAFT_165631 [Ramicandelaber brevisporus]